MPLFACPSCHLTSVAAHITHDDYRYTTKTRKGYCDPRRMTARAIRAQQTGRSTSVQHTPLQSTLVRRTKVSGAFVQGAFTSRDLLSAAGVHVGRQVQLTATNSSPPCDRCTFPQRGIQTPFLLLRKLKMRSL